MVVVVLNLVSPHFLTSNKYFAVKVKRYSLLFDIICLVTSDVSLGLKTVCYLFAGTDGSLSPIYVSWANILCSSDFQLRALTIAIINSCGAALTNIIQQFLYPVTDAPKYKKGFPASLRFTIEMYGWVFFVRYCELRALWKKFEGRDGEVEEEESGNQGKEKFAPADVSVAEKL